MHFASWPLQYNMAIDTPQVPLPGTSTSRIFFPLHQLWRYSPRLLPHQGRTIIPGAASRKLSTEPSRLEEKRASRRRSGTTVVVINYETSLTCALPLPSCPTPVPIHAACLRNSYAVEAIYRWIGSRIHVLQSCSACACRAKHFVSNSDSLVCQSSIR